MNTNEIRSRFLDYFKKHKHTAIPSSSLIPGNDPTLLFTNAGMVQFKDVFLGREQRPYTRATSSQKCVRAGGKHNDLENVGQTARHHTFFEMLGNFSFGDYFKREAIKFAWEFITEELKLPKEKLWVTVFEKDEETADIWLKEMHVNPARFSRCGEKDNFWAMGDTGPCGPCTEIFYDHGADVAGGPPGSPDADGDRYIEIWNLVFMQYNRSADGTLTPLPKPSVDTGMGLERIAAVMQGVHSNYDTDLFKHLITAIVKLNPEINIKKPEQRISTQVIADHIRSTSFLIADGVTPSNEGRGYVLRRIIRRAIRHGNKLGFTTAFFSKLVKPLIEIMGDAYPDLTKKCELIEKVLLNEEEQFALTLEQGLKIYHQEVAKLENNIIPGELVFKLYDTYGFPADLTADIARENNLVIDQVGFDEAMAKQRDKSREASRFEVDYTKELKLDQTSEFTGYHQLTDKGKIIALIHNDKLVQELSSGEKGIVVLDRTPFYAESGGQVGDTGQLIFNTGRFEVTDTQKSGQAILHIGILKNGKLTTNEEITAEVDSLRKDTMLNHTATHLLHAVLRRVLGEHVIQKGSLVEPERLRFDFSHFAAVTAEQLQAVEELVNEQIRANLDSHIEVMSPQAAQQKGAMALFGEKYGEKVRVLSIGEFSIELCGGTHVERTGDIGIFKIISESGSAAGIRRIEAITGKKAFAWLRQREQQLLQISELLKTKPEEVVEKLKQKLESIDSLSKQLEENKKAKMHEQIHNLAHKAEKIDDLFIVSEILEAADLNLLRYAVDQLKQKLPQAVIILGTVIEEKAHLIVGVTKNCSEKYNAGKLVSVLAAQLGGKGGGRPDMAQGGGDKIDQLSLVLSMNKIKDLIIR